MSFLALLRMSLSGLERHRLRALLTVLGITIGIGAFVTMVAMGRGASARVNAQVAAMGANMLVAVAGSASLGGARTAAGSMNTLTEGDVEAIRRECDAVQFAAPLVESQVQVVWRGANWATRVIGTTPEYFSIRQWKLQRGVFFGWQDVAAGAKVCVLGQVVTDQIFGGEDPIGHTIRVRSMSCEVIGTLASKGQGPNGLDYDDIVVMPVDTVRRRLSNNGPAIVKSVGRINISATSARQTTRAQEQVVALLRQRHRVHAGDPEEPQVRDLTELADVAQETARTMTMLLAGIAAVSLVVGGIGVMNIMLVSVTERTREIGIRMAVGATGRLVLLQFLLEAMLLTIAGGLMGMGIGTASAKMFSSLMDWPTRLSLDSYAIGLSVSTVVGLVFGFYPAWRASRLEPVEALAHQ